MKELTTPDFIVVDDDSTNNLICTKVIQLTFPEKKTLVFTIPEDALAYIEANFKEDTDAKVILFLDIEMLSLNGWEVLDKLKNFPEKVIRQFTIYILSSSFNPIDVDKAEKNALVTGYISKPLSQSILLDVCAS